MFFTTFCELPTKHKFKHQRARFRCCQLCEQNATLKKQALSNTEP